MFVFAFGSHKDPQAWDMCDFLKKEFPYAEFVKSDNPQDILDAGYDKITIIDVAKGIKKARILSIDELKTRKIVTLHDFDLGFFLQIMKESGVVQDIKIIGIPEEWDRETIEEVKNLLQKLCFKKMG